VEDGIFGGSDFSSAEFACPVFCESLSKILLGLRNLIPNSGIQFSVPRGY
jgi:hypothetical protein